MAACKIETDDLRSQFAVPEKGRRPLAWVYWGELNGMPEGFINRARDGKKLVYVPMATGRETYLLNMAQYIQAKDIVFHRATLDVGPGPMSKKYVLMSERKNLMADVQSASCEDAKYALCCLLGSKRFHAFVEQQTFV